MLYLGSNATPREMLNVLGSLPVSVQETLVDNVDDVERMRGTVAYIEEAKNCYPTEDCLEPVLKLLRTLHGNLRKSDTKDAIKFILDQADDLQMGLSRAGEYGASELQNALNVLDL
jgi:hypothetical protein